MRAEAGDGLSVGGPGISRRKGVTVESVTCSSLLPFFSLFAAFIDGLPENIHVLGNRKTPLVTAQECKSTGLLLMQAVFTEAVWKRPGSFWLSGVILYFNVKVSPQRLQAMALPANGLFSGVPEDV